MLGGECRNMKGVPRYGVTSSGINDAVVHCLGRLAMSAKFSARLPTISALHRPYA